MWRRVGSRPASAAPSAAAATPPDQNGKIVFRRYFNRAHNRGALFTVNPDGTSIRQLTRPLRHLLDTEPDWSPDGRRIVFQRENRLGLGPPEIFVVEADGTGLTRLTRGRAGCIRAGSCHADPAWSPDGRRIAVTRESGGTGSSGARVGIDVMDADGTSVQQLTQLGTGPREHDLGPQWSPDGARIIFQRVDTWSRRSAIFVVNVDGTGVRRVTPWRLGAGDHPDWSPDGSRILFSSDFEAGPRVSPNIYTIRPDGTGLRKLTRARGGRIRHLSSSFSPDGKWITFGRAFGTGPNAVADVFVMRADGSRVRRVTRTAAWESAPDWGPRR